MEKWQEISKNDEIEMNSPTDQLDILDTTKWIPATRQLINCVICDQKFTNKVIHGKIKFR